jgi:hypothetical protein
MSDKTIPEADNSPLPTSIVKGMRKVRDAYEAEVSEEVVQQSLDRIAAQTVEANASSSIHEHRRRMIRPAFNRSLWFGLGLAAGVAAVSLLTERPIISGLPSQSLTATNEPETRGLLRTQTVAVPDPAHAVRTCIAELTASRIPFSYQVSGAGAALEFAGTEQLSDAMITWLTDHGVVPPRVGEQMRLVFVRAG